MSGDPFGDDWTIEHIRETYMAAAKPAREPTVETAASAAAAWVDAPDPPDPSGEAEKWLASGAAAAGSVPAALGGPGGASVSGYASGFTTTVSVFAPGGGSGGGGSVTAGATGGAAAGGAGAGGSGSAGGRTAGSFYGGASVPAPPSAAGASETMVPAWQRDLTAEERAGLLWPAAGGTALVSPARTPATGGYSVSVKPCPRDAEDYGRTREGFRVQGGPLAAGKSLASENLSLCMPLSYAAARSGGDRQLVMGVPYTAELQCSPSVGKSAAVSERSDYVRWLWAAYSGSLFKRNGFEPLPESGAGHLVVGAVAVSTRDGDTVSDLPVQVRICDIVHGPRTDETVLSSLFADVDPFLPPFLSQGVSAEAATSGAEEGETAPDSRVTRPNGEVYVPRKIGTGNPSYDSTGAHTDVSMLRAARERGLPVLLFGLPGTGKTAMVEAALWSAEAADGLVTVAGTAETEVADFLGSYVQLEDGSFRWVDGALVRAMESGAALFVDEIALIDPRVLATLYSAMDGRGELAVTLNPQRGVVKSAPGFYVVAACNPTAPGAVMSDALLSRFSLHVEVTTDYDLAASLGVDRAAVVFAKNMVNKVADGSVIRAPEMRQLLDYQRVSDLFGQKVALANLVASAEPADRDTYRKALETTYGFSISALRV